LAQALWFKQFWLKAFCNRRHSDFCRGSCFLAYSAMIYICKAFQLPCILCQKSCEGLRIFCKESCKCCGTVFDAIADFFGPVTKGPLAAYVVGTWLTMLLSVVAFVGAYQEASNAADVTGNATATAGADSQDSTTCTDVAQFCLINLGLAVVHAVFARYIQWRITRSNKDTPDEVRDRMTQREVLESATHVAMYDVGFCLYVFFFIGAFAYNCYGASTLRDCSETGPAWAGTGIKILWALCVWNYFFCWYCTKVCCAGKEKAQSAHRDGAGAGGGGVVQAQPVGEESA